MRQPGSKTRCLNSMALGSLVVSGVVFAGWFYWLLGLDALVRIADSEVAQMKRVYQSSGYSVLVSRVVGDFYSEGWLRRAMKVGDDIKLATEEDVEEETAKGKAINELFSDALGRFVPDRQREDPEVAKRKGVLRGLTVLNRKHFLLMNKVYLLACLCAGITGGMVRRRRVSEDPEHFGKESSFKFHYVKGLGTLATPVVLVMYFFAPFPLPLYAVLYGMGAGVCLFLWNIIGAVPGHL